MLQLLFQITIVASTTKKQLQLFVSQPLPIPLLPYSIAPGAVFVSQPLPIHLFPYSISLPYLNTPGAGNTLAFPNLSLTE
jgi:hypothetical protein